MRKCHLNTCPVGIATQDPVLREKFTGKPEHVINYFFLLAEEVRDIMAKLGFRTFNELIGRADKLKVNKENQNYKEASLNYDSLLINAQTLRPNVSIIGGSTPQNFDMDKRLDQKVLELAKDVIDGKTESTVIDLKITNIDRTFGATLSNAISLKYNDIGLKDDSILIKLNGHAGQSFGAFLGTIFD